MNGGRLLHLGVVAGDVKDGTPLQLEVGEGGALEVQQEFLLILSVEIRCGRPRHAICCSSVSVRQPE
jgi:hypothetical protein